MKIEDNRPTEKEKVTLSNIAKGDPFLYIGRLMLRTEQERQRPLGNFAITVVDLFNGSLHDLKEEEEVARAKAKIVIENI